MNLITKCLNEWNATIEALGHGKQTILIRKYSTTLKNFLLYPTVTYALKEGYIKNFQNKYQSFIEENALPNRDGKKIEVKYFAEVEKVIKKPSSTIDALKDHYIWTPKHVKSYIGQKDAYVWVLRVYNLKKPVMAERTLGFKYSNLLEKVSIEEIEPVLSDFDFDLILNEIR